MFISVYILCDLNCLQKWIAPKYILKSQIRVFRHFYWPFLKNEEFNDEEDKIMHFCWRVESKSLLWIFLSHPNAHDRFLYAYRAYALSHISF